MSELDVPSPNIGDDLTVVVVHPNIEKDKDPAAKINGKTAYIRAENTEDFTPTFGEKIDVRVADIQEHNILLTVLDT